MKKNKIEQIDFVITWVDGKDSDWQQKRSSYLGGTCIDNREVRYRDWDNLHYWFRGIEKYADWVNKIYFVTCGQVPAWLNLQHDKIVIVTHDSFMEKKYLPVFNSAAIEVNLHKIKGLSENFVYFNDDTFIISSVRETDFFIHDKPVAMGVENVIPLKVDKDLIVNNIMRNHAMIINNHFSKKNFIKKNWCKWFSLRNGKDVIRNLLLIFWKDFCGFKTFHLPTPFLKSTFLKVAQLEAEILDRTSTHRFRNGNDVSQWLFQNWQIASGNYVLPKRKCGHYFAAGADDVTCICNAICKQKYRVVCINDEVYSDNFEEIRDMINGAFEEIFPEKSSFEK